MNAVDTVNACKPKIMGMNDHFVGMISSKYDTARGWFKTYNLYFGQNTKTVSFKVDTGADANVLPLSHAKSLSATVVGSDARLRSYYCLVVEKLPFGWSLSWWMQMWYQYLVWRLVWG